MRGSVFAAALLLSAAPALAQTDAVVIKSSADTEGDVPRLTVTTSAAGGDAELKVNRGFLKFTSPSSGYLLTVENTTDQGVHYDATTNAWQWRGAGSTRASC